MNEEQVAQRVLLEAGRLGVILWRNNSGALPDKNGRLVRFGLGNDSAQANAKFKSPDYIGFTPTFIVPEFVGRTLPVFTGIDTKHSEWTHPENDRDRAQEAFLRFVQSHGGYAGFAPDASLVSRIVGL